MRSVNKITTEGADQNLTQVPAALAMFQPSGDLHFLRGKNYNGPPVLLLNPDASVDAVLQTAEARMFRLWQLIKAWTNVAAGDAGEVNAVELLGALEPAAEEVHLLLESCTTRLAAGASHG